jgi:hypothetical protein
MGMQSHIVAGSVGARAVVSIRTRGGDGRFEWWSASSDQRRLLANERFESLSQ